jgi:Flp pilus assembly pilin Flp
MMKLLDLVLHEDGASLTEYALVAALVSIAAVVALTSLGSTIASFFSSMASDI